MHSLYILWIENKNNLNDDEIQRFLEINKDYFENNGYNVYFTGARFTYKNASMMVQNNQFMIAVKKELYIKSSATSYEEIGNDIYYGTRDKLIQKGISFEKRKATRLRPEDYKKYDYIIGMEKSNIINIQRIVGNDTDNKIYRLLDFSNNPRDIADPWYTGNFEITYNDIVEGCRGFLKYLEKLEIIYKYS